MDGYAPVYALMSKASAAAGSSRSQQQQTQGEEEKVQVGLNSLCVRVAVGAGGQHVCDKPAPGLPGRTRLCVVSCRQQLALGLQVRAADCCTLVLLLAAASLRCVATNNKPADAAGLCVCVY